MSNELTGILLDESCDISLGELCRVCRISADRIQLLVEEGIIEPRGQGPGQWRFASVSIHRVRRVTRLERDLGINLAGAALALELLEEIDRLKARLRRIEESF